MRYLMALVAASVTLAQGGPAGARVGQYPFAVTHEGQMLGAVQGDVASYKGLAYAAAPLGRLRWRAPQPLPESSEMRTAYDDGAACPQPAVRETSENCLTLNVFRPFGVDGPLPVMVFVHGGSFVAGAASDPLFDGSKLAQAGLIVVVPNYRLGAFGFFAHPALTGDASERGGNFGLMDLIAALRWIHDNVAAFGGDAGNVTLFGEGSGATMIALLMLAEQSRALFHKAILQSIPGRERLPSTAAADATAREFLEIVGRVGKGFDPRAADARLLLAAEELLLMRSSRRFGPMVDGALVTEDVADGFAAGRESRIPLIIGSNDDETSLGRASDLKTELDLAGASAEELRKLYPDVGAAPVNLAAQLYTDRVFTEPVRLLARSHAATGASTFRYRFACSPEAQNADDSHGRELQFVFGVEGVPGAGVLSRGDREVASALRSYWTNFAKTGDPNGQGLPRWDASADRERLLLISNERITSGADPWSARLDRLARRSPKG
ncbi:carboxylesterase family protein [Bradyrhizobium sp.]|uniref:carboxylesterase/lipase family protein n=1 Tax=Bradyrhizobium sp. TaxID=376 RepID=UPI0023916CDE|nr:carboxylesterase family protein [Bradyrhizobium sp.]MDE2376561.1 carboxylesterase family protein [Bradyrhizobium sp.]